MTGPSGKTVALVAGGRYPALQLHPQRSHFRGEEQHLQTANDGAPLPDGLIDADTPVGHELAGVKKQATIQLMGSRLWGRFNPNHWDPPYAAQTGLISPIQTGEMSSAYLAEMCVLNFGRHFFEGSRIVCKYVASTYAGETISTHGVVREKKSVGERCRFTVDIWSQNEAGEKKTVGWVEVEV